jgi:hypothetical protein
VITVLQDIDAARTRGLREDDYRNRLNATVTKYLPLRNEEDVKKDVVSFVSLSFTFSSSKYFFEKLNVSHFVLRLAYCRNQTDRQWLVTQEKFLLKYRLEAVNLSEFLADNSLNFDGVSKVRREEGELLIL